MADTNRELGHEIHRLLLDKGLETPIVNSSLTRPAFDVVKQCHHDIMGALGLDLTDDSLKDTPKRIAKMYCTEIFTGLNYENFPACTTVDNKFGYNEVVKVSGITVQSMCEHHFLPFVGHANVAYIPNKRVLGLSKFNRIVDFFARRPQIQERLTEQVSAALVHILDTEDVAVTITADHYCVKLRGVQDTQSMTSTSRLKGKFKDVAPLRAEFFALGA